MKNNLVNNEKDWTVGIDLGGTKIVTARIDASGKVRDRRRFASRTDEGPRAVVAEIVRSVKDLRENAGCGPRGLGIGVAGQIDPVSGAVRYAPNLDWHDVPIRDLLCDALEIPVFVTNDVRAATWGEWTHGAGEGCTDLVCLFVGTGVGGGVVSRGGIVTGCSNTAGELGHITVDLHGPPCRCGNRGCLEALAGGWAIARSAREKIAADPAAGAALLRGAGGDPETIDAAIVARAAGEGDPLARQLMESATEALVAGAVSLVNAFNPCRLILGGGIIEGQPELISRVERGVREKALAAATAPLQVLASQLHDEAGVIGAAMMARHALTARGGGH